MIKGGIFVFIYQLSASNPRINQRKISGNSNK
jgi:hypothetical protein